MKKHKYTIIGLGNPIMADDGVGIIALDKIREKINNSDSIELIDAGTCGLQLINYIDSRENVILIDAFDADAVAGTIFRSILVEHGQISSARNEDELSAHYEDTGNKVSLHQTEVLSVLELAFMLGKLPRNLVLYGIQVKDVFPHQGLSPNVETGMNEVIDIIWEYIKEIS